MSARSGSAAPRRMPAARTDGEIRRAFEEQSSQVDGTAGLNAALDASLRAYRAHEARLPLMGWEFVWQQALYLRKRWWLAQGAALLLLWLLMRISGSADGVRRCVGVLAPAFGMLALPELWRNRTSGATEVEGAARFSLRQIYAARLLLFGTVDLALLSLFFAAASLGARAEIGALILQFFVPLNVTGCICFSALRRPGIGEGVSLMLCGLWVAVWVLVVLDGGLYARISEPAWCALLAISALGLLRCAARLCRGDSRAWEEGTEWS